MDKIKRIKRVKYLFILIVLSGLVLCRNVYAKEIAFDCENAEDYCDEPVCMYDEASQNMIFTFSFIKGIPKSDDDKVYLFEFATYEDESDFEGKWPITAGKKCIDNERADVKLSFKYRQRHLFARFVPALKVNGEYIALSKGKYISNPEALAINKNLYWEPDTKKGLLIDANTLNTNLLSDLNVKRVVYNLPLSLIMGETTNEACPTEEFKYNGKTYQFDGFYLAGFDSLFEELSRQEYHITLIILNDWNKEFPEMMHPLSRRKTGKSEYYAFNTEEEEAVRRLEATALFLSRRYSSGEHGLVFDWVIANEVNQQKIWNYMGTDDLDYYADSFEKSFRTFYNAIKSGYASAHVCFSIDHDWNNNNGNNAGHFNGRDFLVSFNEKAQQGGNYDWGLSVHPYPNPLTRTRFWRGSFDKSEDAAVITPMNLSTLTDFMCRKELLNTEGNVRDISVTELGFSSIIGEKYQAAAFAYCYYIIEDNPYIKSFLLNRQTDDAEALKTGLALGIYNNDYSAKKLKWVFANIDTKQRVRYLPQMLDVIGFESLEKALKAAK